MRRILYLLCLLIVSSTQIADPSHLFAETAPLHTSTDWQLSLLSNMTPSAC